MTQEEKKERNRAIVMGEVEPTEEERFMTNLKPCRLKDLPKEERTEFARKGFQAMQKKKKERQTAKEILENYLSVIASDEIVLNADIDTAIVERIKKIDKDITLYELIQLVAIGKAIDGNTKAIEIVRDTFGDMPSNKVDITAQSLTESDRELLERVEERLKNHDV